MVEFADQTKPRVEKLIAGLALIRKSANSQKIGRDQVRQELAPLIEALRDLGILDGPAQAPTIQAPPAELPDFASMNPRRFPAAVQNLSGEAFHALVCAVAVRAHDDLAEAEQEQPAADTA